MNIHVPNLFNTIKILVAYSNQLKIQFSIQDSRKLSARK